MMKCNESFSAGPDKLSFFMNSYLRWHKTEACTAFWSQKGEIPVGYLATCSYNPQTITQLEMLQRCAESKDKGNRRQCSTTVMNVAL